MTSGSKSIAAARSRLREAGRELRVRPATEVLRSLERTLDGWSDPDGSWSRRLAERLPAHTGFAQETIRKGLQLGLRHWTGNALQSVVEREIGDPSRLEGKGSSIVSGFDYTACVLAGSIPMPTIQALLLPLVLRSPVLAKPASRDDLTARAVVESLAEIDPLLSRSVEVVAFDSSDKAASLEFLQAPCITAMGSDSTLATLQKHVKPHQRWIGYGHRLSLAIKGSQTPESEWSKRMALDIALWDQLGCLSPAALYAVGDSAHADQVAEALALALDWAEEKWPRGALSTAAAAAIRFETNEARMREAAGHDVRVLRSKQEVWTVVREDSEKWRESPLHRFIRVHPVANAEACLAALQPLGPHIAAVAVDGMGRQTAPLDQALARLGASRIVAAGQMQAPPFGWHHDGQPLLSPLARFSDRH